MEVIQHICVVASGQSRAVVDRDHCDPDDVRACVGEDIDDLRDDVYYGGNNAEWP